MTDRDCTHRQTVGPRSRARSARPGSFKFRGAVYALSTLSGAERAAGVIAGSSGNHAQALALAAQLHKAKATV
ncbi:pyridoxal-phosphate dependent enzyme [Streptomyces capoamus]|uniref:pyridoxal-phosphate dependent enzyme n=1 Tax=Streptomyces capoamus TaxID=68183 RepID=UPI00227D89BE|nr:pyridoxal-phosphate dependent enzyme [Streptomyces capoamus]